MHTISQILEAAAAAFDVTVADLVGPSRLVPVARARHGAVALLLEQRTDLSLVAIGKALGGRDHTTIIGARKRADALASHDPAFAAALADARALLGQRPTAPSSPPPGQPAMWEAIPIIIRTRRGHRRVMRLYVADGQLGVLRYTRPAARVCRRCGCTDDYACIGGCAWTRPGLCSRCAHARNLQ